MTMYGLAMTLGLLLCITEGNCKAAVPEMMSSEKELQSRASVSAGSCLRTPVIISLPNDGDYASFTSPNYPDRYQSFEKCGWKFTTDSSNFLKLSCPTVRMSWFANLYVTDDGQTTRKSCLFCSDTKFEYIFKSTEAIVGLENNFFFRGKGFDCTMTAVERLDEFTTCNCGVAATGRIVGGEAAGENRYPWMTIVAQSSNGRLFCGGSLISDQFVLTAAHCTRGDSASDIQVNLGYYETDVQPSSSIVVTVLEIIEHPSYTSSTDGYDVALLRIPTIDFDAYPTIRPVCLPLGSSTYAGVTATATGWGTTSEGGSLSSVLQMVDVPTLTNAACNAAYSGFITDTMICAGSTGLDSCQGDSGGPLIAANSGGYDEIIGITSWGIGCGRDGYPGVYARVTALQDWIVEEIRSSTTCARP